MASLTKDTTNASFKNICEEDLQLYREAFNLFDKDCSGAIDLNELRDILKSLNEDLPVCDIERMINNIDFNKTGMHSSLTLSGLVDFDEFVAVLAASNVTSVQQNISCVQRRNKTNKASIMNNFNISKESDLREAFGTIDLDNDGYISADDLLKVMQGFDADAEPETCQELISSIDNEKVGRVTFKDFCIMYDLID
jgi:Ca2+-binding EF-hand superfamily protein